MEDFRIDNENKNDNENTTVINYAEKMQAEEQAEVITEVQTEVQTEAQPEAQTEAQTEVKTELNEDFLKSQYYNEVCNKPAKKRSRNILQMVLVSVISSIFGGLVVALLIYYITPVSQNLVRYVPGIAQMSSNLQGTVSGYKKVEIVGDENSRVSAIAEKVGPSIVGIRVTPKQTQSSGFFFSTAPSSPSEGSGIIVSEDGYIITNNHVIESVADPSSPTKISSGSKIEVFLPNQIDKPYTATIVGFDWKTDLAVLKIEGKNLPAAELGNSDEIKVGELAVAIGNPGGMEFMGSVTAGVISGLNRSVEIREDINTSKVLRVIQTDAAINPGNSGGALVNSMGQVIGVNTVKLQATGYEGLGFAIPINTVKTVYESLVNNGYVTGRPWIGIGINPDFNETVANRYKVPAGILVDTVEPLSGASNAGILKGDIITKFDGKAVKVQADLEAIKDEHKIGDVIDVEVYRISGNNNKGETLNLKLTLTEYKG